MSLILKAFAPASILARDTDAVGEHIAKVALLIRARSVVKSTQAHILFTKSRSRSISSVTPGKVKSHGPKKGHDQRKTALRIAL